MHGFSIVTMSFAHVTHTPNVHIARFVSYRWNLHVYTGYSRDSRQCHNRHTARLHTV